MDVITITQLVEKLGLSIVIAVVGLFILVKYVIPAIITNLNEDGQQLQQYRTALLEELKFLRADSNADKKAMLQLIREQNEINGNIRATLDILTDRVHKIDTDVNNLYKMVAREKNLTKD